MATSNHNIYTMSNYKAKTAVDLFAERTFNLIELMKSRYVNQEEFLDGMLKARDQAKQMEKQQIINATIYGDRFEGSYGLDSEQYYNETYGGGNK